MNPLTRYLRDGGDPASLGIRSRRSTVNPELVLFLYGHIDSPKGHPVADAARGIILDESRDWACVARPFDRFFNYGEPTAAVLDYSTASVFEKLDGSLCSLYHHKGRWHVATKGEPDAAGPVGDTETRFAELFWATFKAEGLALPAASEQGLTFMFELMTPLNRVVVDHAEPMLRLLCARDRESGQQYDPALWGHTYPGVRRHELDSDPEALMALFPILDPIQTEGFVVCDAHFNRVKIKHPGYLRLHRLKEGASPKAILHLVRTGEDAEVLAYFPELAPKFEAARGSLARLCARIDAEYSKIAHIESQRDFAEAVRRSKVPLSGVLFKLRKSPDRTTADFLSEVRMSALMAATTGPETEQSPT